MASLICDRFVEGPNCSDDRLESTPPEKEDCVTQAHNRAVMEMYFCIGERYPVVPCQQPSGFDEPIQGCLHELRCINYQPLKDLRDCYCTGLSGLSCTVCDDQEEVEEELEEEVAGETTNVRKNLKPIGLTASSYDIPIPIVCGQVIVGGNIIWVGNQRVEERTTTDVAGTSINVTVTQYGFVDIAIGLCKGPIEGISRIWIGDTLVVNDSLELVDADATSLNREFYDLGLNTEIMLGTAGQRPSLEMVNDTGFGTTPAHRDMAVLILKSFPVFTSTTAIPTIRVEVVKLIDESVARFETSSLGGTITDALLEVDPISGRALVSDGGGNIQIIDTATLTEVNELDHASAIVERSVTWSPEADIMYQAAGDTRFTFGYSHIDYVDSSVPPDISSTGDMASIVAHDGATFAPYQIVAVAQGQDIELFIANWHDRTLDTSVQHTSLFSPGAYVRMLVDDFGMFNESAPLINKQVIAFAQSGADIIRITTIDLERPQALAFYSTASPPITFPISATWLGSDDGTMTFVDAWKGTANNIFMTLTAGSINKIVEVKTEVLSLGWYVDVPELPDNFNSRTKLRPNVSREYSYIGPSGTIYSLNGLTGLVDVIGTLSDYGAPDIIGPQYYDGANTEIIYNSTGDELTKLYVNKIAAAPCTLDVLLLELLEIAEIDRGFVDVSAVSGISMDGFLIDDQGSVMAVIQELMAFFHVSGIDAGGKLTFRPLGTYDTVVVPDAEEKGAEEIRVVSNVENISAVEVKYYDTDRLSSPFTQNVTRDFFEQIGDFVNNTQAYTYAAAVFTDGGVARVSAERTMMRLLDRKDTLSFYCPPRNLDIEPSDYVNVLGITGHRVKVLTVDSSLSIQVEAMSEDKEIYDYSATIAGQTPVLTDNSRTDFDGPLRNFPVLFDMPPFVDAPSTDMLHVGIAQPDPLPAFSPTALYTAGPRFGFDLAGTPTSETYIGSLVSFPAKWNQVWSTDKQNSIVILFNDELTGSEVDSLTDLVDVYNSYTKNLLFVGKELVQYKTAVIDGDNKTVTFTGLVRGRFGTDQHMNSHVAGEICAIYDPNTIMSNEIPWSVSSFNIALAATYDPLAPKKRRVIEREFSSFVDGEWPIGAVKFRKEAVSSAGLYFKMFPREVFENTFFETVAGPQVFQKEYFGGGQPAIAFLNAPYVEATFLAALEEEGFPFNGNSAATTNSYIYGMFVSRAAMFSPTDLTDGRRWTETAMGNSGITIASNIWAAAFIIDGGVPQSAVKSIYIPGSEPFTEFDGANDL